MRVSHPTRTGIVALMVANGQSDRSSSQIHHDSNARQVKIRLLERGNPGLVHKGRRDNFFVDENGIRQKHADDEHPTIAAGLELGRLNSAMERNHDECTLAKLG